MPPFKEGLVKIDRGLSGDLLKFLREVGHGHRITIVDASYDIPQGAHTLDYPGRSADALLGIVSLIPVEKPPEDRIISWKLGEVVVMAPDDGDAPAIVNEAGLAFEKVSRQVGEIGLSWTERNAGCASIPGFYELANSTDQPSTFIRTTDDLPFACASFVVGHSQRTE